MCDKQDLLGEVFDVFDSATEHVHAEAHHHTLIVTHQPLEGDAELVVRRRFMSLGSQELSLSLRDYARRIGCARGTEMA